MPVSSPVSTRVTRQGSATESWTVILLFVHVEGDVGGVEEVVGEELLDDVALVAAADDEVVDAVLGVELEDVPEDGAAADFDHRLGAEGGFFGDARAEAAGEDDCFHRVCEVLRADTAIR